MEAEVFYTEARDGSRVAAVSAGHLATIKKGADFGALFSGFFDY